VLPEFQLNFASAAAADSTRLAEDVRRAMDLGSIPSAALLRSLEDCYGVKVFWEQLTEAHDGDCSAACARGEFGSAILIDASEAPWRRNFSLAHELFHLLTWNSMPVREADSDPTWPERIERLAENFAGSLLLPADSLSDRFTARAQDGKITYGELVRMARDFGVSTQALLIRLRDLRHIKATDVARLLKDETFRRVDEASWVDRNVPAVPFSARYVELAYAAFQRGIIGVSMLAKYLEKPIADLELPETKVEDAAEAALTVV
ncbi:MAG: ImmA/IrrE family metallo-endopeptidase, partial [Longimicrobiales bacterium]